MLRIEIPPLMKNILKEINKAVLKQQSSFVEPDKVMSHEEIVEFLAVYLNTMARLRDSTGQNPLEMTVDIEHFEDEGHVDLHITDSSFTDETKPLTVSSLVSVSKSPKTGSMVSLQSHKSAAEKPEDVKQKQETETNEDEKQDEEEKQQEKIEYEEEKQPDKTEAEEENQPDKNETETQEGEEQHEKNEDEKQELEEEQPEQALIINEKDQAGNMEEDVPAEGSPEQ